MTDDLKRRAEIDMALVDTLPAPIKELVHIHGKIVLKLWRAGIRDATEISKTIDELKRAR